MNDELVAMLERLMARLDAAGIPDVVEQAPAPPPMPPVPDGWGEPSPVLETAQRQYADAATQADAASQALVKVVDDWRSILIRPKAVDAMFIAAQLVLRKVNDDYAHGLPLRDDTAAMMSAYFSSSPSDPLMRFLSWASDTLVEVATEDAEARSILSDLYANDMADLVASIPTGDDGVLS